MVSFRLKMGRYIKISFEALTLLLMANLMLKYIIHHYNDRLEKMKNTKLYINQPKDDIKMHNLYRRIKTYF